MAFEWTPYSLAPAFAAALAVSVGLFVFRRSGPGGSVALTFGWLLAAAALWAATSALEKAAVGIPAKVLISKIQYLGIAAAPPLWLMFCLIYARRDDWLTPRNLILLWTLPCVTVVAAATNDWHGWLWSSFTPSPVNPERLLIYGHGPWFYAAAAYNYLLLLSGSAALVWAVVRHSDLYKRQAAALLAGVAAPWVANGVYLAGYNPLPGLDPTPVSFAVTGVIFAWGVFRWQLADLRPAARDAVLESMRDGVIVLDAAGRILDINPAGQAITGKSATQVVGKAATEVWPEHAGLLAPAPLGTPAAGQFEIVGGPPGTRRHFHVQLSPLQADGGFGGWAVVLRDITERKRFEERLAAANADLAQAVERTNEFARLAENRARVADTLREAGEAVAANLSSTEAIQSILQQLMRVVPCEYAWVQVRDGSETELVGGRGVGPVEASIGMRFPISPNRASGKVYLERRTLIVNDAPASGLATFADPHFSDIRSWMGVPLLVHGEAIGLLTLDSREPNHFTERHRELAEAFAMQAAIALENARLFNETRRLAVTDGLTGLYNRRYFFERAEMEFQRARRYNLPLSAILLDVDFFKAINDAHGHAAGDRVLQGIAAEVHSHLRSVDLLGRYGGEEFVLLLPNTAAAGAHQVADRLRAAVAALMFDIGGCPVQASLSLGVAELTEDCPTLDALLESADRALYAAKRGGRNRVEVAL